MKTRSVELARIWGVEPNFQQKIVTCKKNDRKQMTEEDTDDRIDDSEKDFE